MAKKQSKKPTEPTNYTIRSKNHLLHILRYNINPHRIIPCVDTISYHWLYFPKYYNSDIDIYSSQKCPRIRQISLIDNTWFRTSLISEQNKNQIVCRPSHIFAQTRRKTLLSTTKYEFNKVPNMSQICWNWNAILANLRINLLKITIIWVYCPKVLK